MESVGRSQHAGVNVVGFFHAEFGQGEAARRVLLALRQAEVPYSAINYDRVPHRQDHPFEANGTAEYPANVICLNAEHLLQFVQDGGAAPPPPALGGRALVLGGQPHAARAAAGTRPAR